MVISLLILVMVWLTSCAVCTAVGFFSGLRHRKHRPAATVEITEEEKRRAEREIRELQNFFDYDGSEQKPVNTH